MPFAPDAAERRRREQFIRAGAGFVRPEFTLDTPGAGLTSPVTIAQLGEPVTIFFDTILGGAGTTYPVISQWLQTGAADELVVTMDATGLVDCVLPDGVTSLSVQLEDVDVPPFGLFRMAIYVEPVAGESALFVNGALVAEETFTPNAGEVWGQVGATWDYLSVVPTDADLFDFRPLEIFPGFKPAIV